LLAWIACCVAGGLAAGLVALGLLEALNLLTVEYWDPLTASYVWAYLVAGALVALTIGTLGIRARGGTAARASLLRISAVTLAVLYAPLVYDRVYDSLRYRSGSTLVGIAAASAVVGVYALWVAVLRRVARGGAVVAPPLIAALTVAVAIVLDRNVFGSTFKPVAIASNTALVLVALAAATATRATRPVRIATAVGLLFIGLVGGVALAKRSPPPQLPVSSAGPANRKPDVVLVVIDALRADVFDAVVRDTEEGRAFRRALGGAVWFKQAIAVAPWTLPAIGSIMTGRYPAEHGMDRDPASPSGLLWLLPLADSVPTLAERLQRAGYVTEAIGTNHILNARLTRIDRGFMRYEILQDDVWRFPVFSLTDSLGLFSGESAYKDAGSVRRRLRGRLKDLGHSERPLFMWIHLMETHAPLQPHDGLSRDSAGVGLAELDHLYRDAARYALVEVTRMVEVLKEQGRWSNTLLVVTSDHGEMFPSDGQHASVLYPDGTPRAYGHGHALYDTLLRIPLVIRPPGGLPADRDVMALANQVDLHATLCGLLGLEPPHTDSVSLAGWLTTGVAVDPPPQRAATIAGAPAYGPDQHMLRTTGEKLIQYPGGEHPPEFYNLDSDPGEKRNIAEKQADRVAQSMSQLSERWSALSVHSGSRHEPVDSATRERLRALGYTQ